jgi:hypothetical protein
MKTVWDIAPCSLVKLIDVSEVNTASIITAMEAIRTSETSVNFYETTWPSIPDGLSSSLQMSLCIIINSFSVHSKSCYIRHWMIQKALLTGN